MFVLMFHYVFNLSYNAPNIFEFLQRAFLKIGLIDLRVKGKVSTLMRALKVDQ